MDLSLKKRHTGEEAVEDEDQLGELEVNVVNLAVLKIGGPSSRFAAFRRKRELTVGVSSTFMEDFGLICRKLDIILLPP